MATTLFPPQALTFIITIVLYLTQGANAAVDFQKCCTQVPVDINLRPFQWDACHSEYNASETDPRKKYAPSILTTYGWCRQNCEKSGKFEISDTSQWLTPLAAWIIPASALLLLLPISEHLKSNRQTYQRTRKQKIISHYINNWLHPMIEYIQILGDPASAFNGSLAQMIADWHMCLSLHRPNNGKRERELILTVILVEQADFWCLATRNAFELMAGSDRAREYSKTACKVIWSARKKFNTSVVLPIALYIGVAAAVFYDAYQKLGDGGTSHSLAYGVWYNWILFLSVFSNCFASHSNLDAVRSGTEMIVRGVVENLTLKELEDLGWDKQAAQTASDSYEIATQSLLAYPLLHPPMNPSPRELYGGSLECQGIPLHKRYWNTWQWIRWLHKNGVDICRPREGIWRHNIFWVDWEAKIHPWRSYLVTQLLSWVFVLYSCACAATLSYTTPKVSLGCRSINHIIYAAISLLNAVIRVLKDNLEQSGHKRSHAFVSSIYHFFVWLNGVFVLIGGSTLQITGVFSNCFCKAGIVDRSPNSSIPMSPNTFAHQYWARRVWLRVAYSAYGGVAAICFLALFVRLYIARAVRKGLY